MRRDLGKGVPLALIFLLLATVGPSAGSHRFDRNTKQDGKIAYSVAIDRGDCGRVIDCGDSRILIRDPGRVQAITVSGCPPGDCDDSEPAWSHDGRTLIFLRYLFGSFVDGYASDPTGRQLREVRSGAASSLSVSGQRIAYEGSVVSRGRTKSVLFVGSLDPDGETRRRTKRRALQPAWGPSLDLA